MAKLGRCALCADDVTPPPETFGWTKALADTRVTVREARAARWRLPTTQQTLAEWSSDVMAARGGALPASRFSSGYETVPAQVASEVRDLEIRSLCQPADWYRHLRTAEAVRLRQSAAATEVVFPANESADLSNSPLFLLLSLRL